MCLAIPGKILTPLEVECLNLRRATVDFCGVRREVSLDFTPEAAVGDYVLVHVGVALTVVEEQEAHHVYAALEALGELDELKEGAL